MRPIDPVAHVRGGGQRLKTVQKAGGNIEMAKVFVVKHECLFASERGRLCADVDQDVVHGTVGTTHQLRLAATPAPVHAADHALPGPGLGILDESRRSAGAFQVVVEDLRIESAGEQSAVVVEWLRGENENVHQGGRFDKHKTMLS